MLNLNSDSAISASIGMGIVAEPFDDTSFDTLIVGGGTTIEPSTPRLIEFVRQGVERYRRVAATCTGAVGVCKTGSPTMRMGTTAMTAKLKARVHLLRLRSGLGTGNLT